jgi:REP element-mobilizing transposase RayT
MDQGHGSCDLENPAFAAIVEEQLRFFDGRRYDLHAWVVMPNHVHALITPYPGITLGEISKSWKGYSARRINERLGRRGPFWSRDYFDRYIRDEAHFAAVVRYIEANPVRAGLCREQREWQASSAGGPVS